MLKNSRGTVIPCEVYSLRHFLDTVPQALAIAEGIEMPPVQLAGKQQKYGLHPVVAWVLIPCLVTNLGVTEKAAKASFI